MVRRKSLLIGCNYEGTANQLKGCRQDVENVAEFLSYRGYGNSPRDQVILTDAADINSPYFPNGHNIIAAIDWLVSEPGYVCRRYLVCSHTGDLDTRFNHREDMLTASKDMLFLPL